MKLVIDASVAVKWFVDEERRDLARRALERSNELGAPNLLFVEVANALRNKVRLGSMELHQARSALSSLPGFFDRMIDVQEVFQAAFDLSCDLNHPVADCIYLACGKVFDAPVLTDDQTLVQKAALLGGAPIAVSLRDWASEHPGA